MPARKESRDELKRRLVAALDDARDAVALHSTHVAAELSPSAIALRSFKKHRVIWLAGVALTSVVAVRWVSSSASRKNERDNLTKSGTKGRLFRMLAVPLVAAGRKAAFDFASQYFKNHFKQPFKASGAERDPI